MVTPSPKVYPPTKIEEVREISGLTNFSKIAEKIVGKVLISDTADARYVSQYGNEKGISVNHYLIKKC